MRFDENSRKNIDLIKKIPIKFLPDGTKILLEQVADIYESNAPNTISRENSMRRIVISANAEGRDINSLIKEIKTKIDNSIKLPQGYHINFGGQYESQESASRLMSILSILSIIGIFLVLFIHFHSAFIAIQIMLNIPMAFIGGILAIYLTGNTISVASLVAFVTLCGIASRNGIMMISHYLHLMQNEGEHFSKEMVIRGSLERLIPVLMTALTAILGLIPLVIFSDDAGKEILHPVAVVIVGGLISSTLLDIFVTPTVFYHYGKKSAEKYLSANKNNNLFNGDENE